MKWQPLAIALTLINFVIMMFLLAQIGPAKAHDEAPLQAAKILRAQALEIVDSLGKRRATITVEPAVTIDNVSYPQAVVFRLIDTKGSPLVKLTAQENGGGLNLSDEADGGIRLLARNKGSFVSIRNNDGKEQVLKP